MKTIYSILALLIFTTTTSFAQKKAMKEFFENVKEIQQRPIKIVLLKEGKALNDKYNKNITKAIDSEWYINENYSFIDGEEFKRLQKEKTTEFAFLMYSAPKTNTTRTKITMYEDGLIFFAYNKKGKKIPVIATDICFEKKCSEADYYYTIQDIQNKIYALANISASSGKKMKVKDARAMMEKHQKEQQENIKKLEEMTLYVNEKSLNEKLKNEFDKYYKFDYKIVSLEEIEKAVVENNDKVVILYENILASADTGNAILSFIDTSKMRGLKLKAAPIETVKFFKELFSHEIQKKDLERLKEVLK